MPSQLDRPLTHHRIRTIAADFLGSSSSRYSEVIDHVLDASGTSDEGLVFSAIQDHGDFAEYGDDLLVHLPTALDGTTWMCRVTLEDEQAGSLPGDALPHVLWMVMDSPLKIVDGAGARTGTEISWEETDVGGEWLERFVGAPGWLGGAAGRTMSFAFGPHATVELALTDRVPSLTEGLRSAVRDAFRLVARGLDDESDADSGCATTDEVLTAMLGSAHDLLVDIDVPPLDELASECGLTIRGGLIADGEFDWEELDRRNDLNRLEHSWDLDPDGVAMLRTLIEASNAVVGGADVFQPGNDDDRVAADAFAIALDAPGMARAFWGEHAGAETSIESLNDFAQQVLDATTHDSSGARWVAAKCLDHLGRPVEALELLEAARRSGGADRSVLEMLAGYRSDQGDASAALSLLREAGIFDDVDDPEELEHHQLFMEIADFAGNRPKAAARRNDPCPCGSGKKYKKCHLGQERHALDDRAVWLYSRMSRYVRENRFRRLHGEIAQAMAEASGLGPRAMLDLLDTPIASDLVLAEMGAGRTFATERDALLPDDEALIAAQWSLLDRSLYEVEATTDSTLALRDLRSGDRLTVTHTTSAAGTTAGTLLLGRAFPVRDTWRSFAGFVPIAAHRVDVVMGALDDGDPFVLASIIGSALAPPEIRNTSGDVMQIHTMEWRLPDGIDVPAKLVEEGVRDHGDGQFVLVRDTNQPDSIIASFEWTGEVLRADCNSDTRAAEVFELVADVFPDAVLEDHDIVGADEMLERAEQARGRAPTASDPMSDPAIRAAMEEQIAVYEARWLDEEIPALGGRTPRDCAADPIGRTELERLLTSIPDTDDPTQMSGRRIRAALGL